MALLQEKVNYLFSLVKVAYLVLLILALTLPSCTQTKPQSVGNPLTLRVNKPPQHTPLPEESDNEISVEHYGVSLSNRNLPLAGTTWEWEGALTPQGFADLNDSSGYRLEFKRNGWFDFQADCRRGAGIYEANGERIALTVIKLSQSSCRRDSRVDDFLNALESARVYRLNDGKLFFDIKHEDKTLVFHLKP